MNRRSYQNAADVQLLQTFTSEARAATDGCGYIHPGDIPHRLFSGNKLYDPAEVLTIWEDEAGVAAWVLIGPRHRAYDAQIRPDLRGGAFEREVLAYADDCTAELMRCHGIEGDQMFGDAARCDTVRSDLLKELGWTLDGDPPYVVNQRSLHNLPELIIPEGYAIRPVEGLHEAEALAEIHSACFGSTWTPVQYHTLMQTPGYDAEREYVAVAPDGALAAFTETWRDSLNRTGLLEPVGTHPDHRRKGLGRAIVLYALHTMASEGMTTAEVANSGDNEASRALYAACGFKPWQFLEGYVKPIDP